MSTPMPSPPRPSAGTGSSSTRRGSDSHASSSASPSFSHAQQRQQQQEDDMSHAKGYPRERNDSSSTSDSGISMGSLKGSLPSPLAEDSRNDNDEATADPATATRNGGRGGDSESDGIDRYEKALRRYSCDVAAHTAHMFETCYGGEIEPTSTANTDNKSSSSNRNSASRSSNRQHEGNGTRSSGASSPSKRTSQ